jgi:hypothetical protein
MEQWAVPAVAYLGIYIGIFEQVGLLLDICDGLVDAEPMLLLLQELSTNTTRKTKGSWLNALKYSPVLQYIGLDARCLF